MDLKTYEKLKKKRSELGKKFDESKDDAEREELLKQINEIADQIKSDPPTIEVVYGAIDPSRK